ncbi:MAG TPA: PIN domain-containing protein [Actinomycetota bacterium]
MIFVDTSFWVAVIAARDAHHDEAIALLRAHADDSMITSNHVRGETWTFLRRRYGHDAAIRFLDRLERTSRTRVERVGEKEEADAERWLRRHDERPFSWVDGTSFALMRALRIKRALTFDADFTAAGFEVLRA